MKHFIFTLAITCSFLTQMEAAAKKTVPTKENWIDDQTDQTDIYGIPLDTSEAEEEQEEEQLQKYSQKYYQKNSKKLPAQSR